MSSSRVDGLEVDTENVTLEAFELQPPLWELVLQLCPEKETGEVRRVLGHSLVEQACDLYEEANTLLEIWRQFREDTDDVISCVCVTPCLPEPPAVRERLVQEIQFFVEYLQQQQQQQRRQQGGGSGTMSALLEENSRVILDYVARRKEGDCSTYDSGGGSRPMSHNSGGGSRPMSVVSSRDGRETLLRHTPSSEEGSQPSVLSDHVETVNAMDIDAIVKHLRDVLEDECAQRRRDILFLQDCLDGEKEHQRAAVTEAARSEPTLQELREFGTRLEQEILHEAKFKLPPPHTCTSSAGNKRSSQSVPRLLPHLPSSHPPAASVTRASRVRRREASVHAPHSSTRTPKQPHDSTHTLSTASESSSITLDRGTEHSSISLNRGTEHSSISLNRGTEHSSISLNRGTEHSSISLNRGTEHSSISLDRGTEHSSISLDRGTEHSSSALNRGTEHSSSALNRGTEHSSSALDRGTEHSSISLSKRSKTTSMSGVPTPDSPLHRCHSCGTESLPGGTHSDSIPVHDNKHQTATHRGSLLIQNNSSRTGNPFSKPIT